MNEKFSTKLKLPAVALGLSFFVGCLLGRISPFLLIPAAAFAAISFILRKNRLYAAGLLLGMLALIGRAQLYEQPLSGLNGEVLRVQCHIVSQSYSSESFSVAKAVCILEGRPAVITVTGRFDAEPGTNADMLLKLCLAGQNDYNYADGIILQGSVQETYDSSQTYNVFYWANKVYSAAANRLDILGGDEAALAKGLLLGDKSDFSLSLKHDITYSGTNYMCAVSGAHITLCVTLITELFCRNRRRLCAWVTVISVAAFALLFNFSPSVMRAGFMLIICRCAVLFHRKAVTFNSLCVALLLMTLFTPNAAFDPALQMSALGVFGVSEVGLPLCRIKSLRLEKYYFFAKLKEAAFMSVGAMLCIAPVSVSLFGGISLTEIPASVALSPFFTLAVMLGLLFLLSGVSLIALPLKLVLQCFRGVLGFFGGTNDAWLALDFGAAAVLSFVTAALLVGAAVTYEEYSRTMLKCCGLSILLTVCLSINNSSDRSCVEFVSSGSSGAAIICRRNEAAVLISGSGGIAEELFDCLSANGITRIKLINAPQLDYNGMVALEELAEIYPTETVLCPEGMADYCSGRFEDTGIAADTLEVGGVKFAMIKSGDASEADIAIYYSYTKGMPDTGAGLALYASSWQNEIPENGINIHDEKVKITDF